MQAALVLQYKPCLRSFCSSVLWIFVAENFLFGVPEGQVYRCSGQAGGEFSLLAHGLSGQNAPENLSLNPMAQGRSSIFASAEIPHLNTSFAAASKQ